MLDGIVLYYLRNILMHDFVPRHHVCVALPCAVMCSVM